MRDRPSDLDGANYKLLKGITDEIYRYDSSAMQMERFYS